MSQFLSDLKGRNYYTDYNHHLLDLSKISNVSNDNNYDNSRDRILNMSESNAGQVSSKPLTASEENEAYYMAGVTLHAILKFKKCDTCRNMAETAIDKETAEVPRHLTYLTENANMGGLKEVTSGIYRICRETEREFQHQKDFYER